MLTPLPSLLALATCGVSETVAGVPSWYTANRVHAHARISINANCKKDAVTQDWACTPLFENAAADFAALGARAFVRHTHTADEGAWWPSTSGPPASWHPLVQATNRSLPSEFLAKATAAGTKVIFYHYMKTNAYFAEVHPEWVQRWPNGSAVVWARGMGLSPCADGWQSVYIQQVLELVRMGADAFYFDEFPGSWGGDWSEPCLELWANSSYPSTLGEPMPTALIDLPPTAASLTTPVSADRRVQLLMSDVTEQFFERLTTAIEGESLRHGKPVASIVSVYQVPKLDGGYGTAHRTGLYETTSMLDGLRTCAKTELHIPAAVHWLPRGEAGGGDQLSPDVLMAFGFAQARDAAAVGSSSTGADQFDGHRPPHVWLPKIATEQQATASVGALLAWGAVANLDNPDAHIPQPSLFSTSYSISNALAPHLARIGGGQPLEPLGYATLLFSEKARNQYLPDRAPEAWEGVLWPTVGAWGAMVRGMVPVQVIADWQVEQLGVAPAIARVHPVLLVPGERAHLLPETQAALDRYEAAGGKALDVSKAALSGHSWNSSAARPALEAQLLAEVMAVAPAPPPVVGIMASPGGSGGQREGEGEFVHTVGYQGSGRPNELLVFLAANFSWCVPGSAAEPPAPVTGFTVRINAQQTTADVPLAADLLTNSSLRVTEGEFAKGEWVVHVPPFSQFFVIGFCIGGQSACPSYSPPAPHRRR
jgi:hypothetical protein